MTRIGSKGALVAACLALGAPAQLWADEGADEAARASAMKTAVTRGLRWLLEHQREDGSWNYENRPLVLSGDAYPMRQGIAALCAFTLLKCGIGPDEEPVKRAFELIHAHELKWTYAVGCVLLALEAKTSFDPERDPVAGATLTRERPKRAKPDARDRELAERCVAWLVAHQRETGLWRYGGGSDEDLSNAQYAMLGLDAAERMGVAVPKEVYEKAALRLIETQREGDEQVTPFPIPGADHSFRDLAKIEQKLRKELKKIERKYARDDDEEAQVEREDRVHTAERKAAEAVLESVSREQLVARGWAYYPPGVPGDHWKVTVNGSMTASAMAALFICKARLERTPRFERELRPKIDAALRSGAAWLAKHFAIDQNPGGQYHHYYYLYGLERAGVLGLIQSFGPHEWFDLGVEHLLKAQGKTGQWKAAQSTAGAVPDTCFALLFLARGTTPVVELPRRVVTGGGRTYGGD